MKKFFAVIGNPPYQEESVGENDTYAPQIYNKFMDAVYDIADKVELVHPGRFLFNAGSTPKDWNKKMLNDKHFKILQYESDSRVLFPNVNVTGGIAISLFDKTREFDPIGVFTPFGNLNNILKKVRKYPNFESLEQIVYSRTVYRLTDKMHKDHPEAIAQLSNGHAYDMSSNIFERLPQIFFENKPNDNFEYIKMFGRSENNRAYKWIRRDYVKNVNNLDKYKIVLAQADGAAGTIGNPIPARIIGNPVIECPGIGTTESFISIGAFETKKNSDAALKYIKTRFARTLISVLKVTQAIPPEKFRYVPLQDFTSKSDIDWTKSVHEIDLQLYKKYGLSKEEKDFIETHVKEMV